MEAQSAPQGWDREEEGGTGQRGIGSQSHTPRRSGKDLAMSDTLGGKEGKWEGERERERKEGGREGGKGEKGEKEGGWEGGREGGKKGSRQKNSNQISKNC